MPSARPVDAAVPENSAGPTLRALGLSHAGQITWNAAPPILVEEVLAHGEGILAANGAVVVRTGSRTGRSPHDKFIVADPAVASNVWWGPINRPMPPDQFDRLYRKAQAYVQGR